MIPKKDICRGNLISPRFEDSGGLGVVIMAQNYEWRNEKLSMILTQRVSWGMAAVGSTQNSNRFSFSAEGLICDGNERIDGRNSSFWCGFWMLSAVI